MAGEQVKSNTVFIRDNLEVMRGFNSEMVDLIYLDPPFNKNQDYEAPIGSPLEGTGLSDNERCELAIRHPAVYSLIEAARAASGTRMQEYLLSMAGRLIEMYRILKSTGSLFLHCDDSASRYVKLLLDAIFGGVNYQVDIFGRRSGAKRFGTGDNSIVYYSKSEVRTWNTVSNGHRSHDVVSAHGHQGDRGNSRSGDLMTAGPGAGNPTQKPLALIARFIEAASNPGDLVFDPFCGCATTLVAAHNLERRWIGIDVSPKAAVLVRHRLAQTVKPFDDDVIVREDVPRRTDVAQGIQVDPRERAMLLYGLQEGYCWGCRDHFKFCNMTQDHIVAQDLGGQDHFQNLQLMCGACNSKKGAKSMPVFIQQLEAEGLRPPDIKHIPPYLLLKD